VDIVVLLFRIPPFHQVVHDDLVDVVAGLEALVDLRMADPVMGVGGQADAPLQAVAELPDFLPLDCPAVVVLQQVEDGHLARDEVELPAADPREELQGVGHQLDLILGHADKVKSRLRRFDVALGPFVLAKLVAPSTQFRPIRERRGIAGLFLANPVLLAFHRDSFGFETPPFRAASLFIQPTAKPITKPMTIPQNQHTVPIFLLVACPSRNSARQFRHSSRHIPASLTI